MFPGWLMYNAAAWTCALTGCTVHINHAEGMGNDES